MVEDFVIPPGVKNTLMYPLNILGLRILLNTINNGYESCMNPVLNS